MCMYFKTEIDVAQSLIIIIFLTVRRPFHRKDFKWRVRGIWKYGLLSEEREALHAELKACVCYFLANFYFLTK